MLTKIHLLDYILKLHQHLAAGQRKSGRHAKSRHLDSSAFWRDQHAQLEVAFADSQAKTAGLERKIDLLERQLKLNTYSTNEVGAASGGKRKRATADNGTSSKSSKRPKPGKDLIEGEAERLPPDTFAEDFDTVNLAGKGLYLTLAIAGADSVLAGAITVQHLYRLHKLFQQSSQEYDGLAYHLCQAASSLATVISAVCKQNSAVGGSSTAIVGQLSVPVAAALQSKQAADLAAIFRASARAFSSLLHGLTKITNGDADRMRSGPIVYAFTKAFTVMLDCITEASLARAEKELAAAEAETSSTGVQKSKTKSKILKTAKEESVPRAVSTFLAALISYLDASDAAHRELFEGFMFVLLERTAKRLYVYTFNRERSATIEHDISPPMTLGSAGAGAKKELEKKTMNIEAPNLLAVLERAMAVAPAHMAAQPVVAASQASRRATGATKQATGRTGGSTGKTGLSLNAKDKLQRTLVNAMFGCDEDSDFMDCLRMPARFPPISAPPKFDEQQTGDWFKEELWRLLGWEILGRETDW
ncbi:hypothetical protein W97_03371 [Coniosporium apollinis CBS 100218]|uniref:Uncharacterized protein n=1 Tax=Coniosporium apollinis (strain CBS 100218) TaxID=1168221 RepID=R7YR86_CONA1|nr:uncharacterized protein W97_03371 [Coniosporium apollinis CBS 100218]EON64141.1 hypothetical protein W97_03371 [Coniosporium apollinis CBS 100218]